MSVRYGEHCMKYERIPAFTDLIRKNSGQWKPVFSRILCSGNFPGYKDMTRTMSHDVVSASFFGLIQLRTNGVLLKIKLFKSFQASVPFYFNAF